MVGHQPGMQKALASIMVSPGRAGRVFCLCQSSADNTEQGGDPPSYKVALYGAQGPVLARDYPKDIDHKL